MITTLLVNANPDRVLIHTCKFIRQMYAFACSLPTVHPTIPHKSRNLVCSRVISTSAPMSNGSGQDRLGADTR